MEVFSYCVLFLFFLFMSGSSRLRLYIKSMFLGFLFIWKLMYFCLSRIVFFFIIYSYSQRCKWFQNYVFSSYYLLNIFCINFWISIQGRVRKGKGGRGMKGGGQRDKYICIMGIIGYIEEIVYRNICVYYIIWG